jgi:hypothetical protein
MNIYDDFDNVKSVEYLQDKVGIKRFNSLIKQKIKDLQNNYRFPIKVFVYSTLDEIKRFNIVNKGVATWAKTEYKYPLNIRLDTLNLKGIHLLAIFLHECGHIEDTNNVNIKLKTNKSEISAWKHAFESFYLAKPEGNEVLEFIDIVTNALKSYNLYIKNISELKNYTEVNNI